MSRLPSAHLLERGLGGAAPIGWSRGWTELPETRHDFLGKEREVLHRLPVRHVAEVEVEDDAARVGLLDPMRDRFCHSLRCSEDQAELACHHVPVELAMERCGCHALP